MILGFKKQFIDKILDGVKIHTIREDSHNRWEPGRKIHMATGVRTSYYHQFHEAECVSVQKIKIRVLEVYHHKYPGIWIDNKFLDIPEMEQLAAKDGFDSMDDFLAWFDKDFTGKIIHWTDKKY